MNAFMENIFANYLAQMFCSWLQTGVSPSARVNALYENFTNHHV